MWGQRMNNFIKAIDFTLPWETGKDKFGHIRQDGGYNNHPDDPGGETKWGISKRAYPNLDIKNLSLGQAFLIYKEDYYDKYKSYKPPLDLDSVPMDYAICVFDTGVNCGVGRTFKWHRMSEKEKDPTMALLGLRQEHYASLPTFHKFGKGWMNRLNDLRKYVEVVRADTASRS